MRKKRRKLAVKPKISQMVLDMAAGYINLGETREDRENYLRSACSAWNIACLPVSKRKRFIKKYLKQYQKINGATLSDCQDLEENLEKLIAQKERLYPDVNTQIIDSRIEDSDGRDRIVVISATMS